MSPGHQYSPSDKKPTAVDGKSYNVSHTVEAFKEVEQNISLIVNHIKSILSGFENVKLKSFIFLKKNKQSYFFSLYIKGMFSFTIVTMFI